MLSNSKEKPVLDVEPKINFGIRTAVLVLLCCQNAGHALLTRYSQGHQSHSVHASNHPVKTNHHTWRISKSHLPTGILKETYSSTEVVLVGEIIKLTFSGYLAVVDRSETGKRIPRFVWVLNIYFRRKKHVVIAEWPPDQSMQHPKDASGSGFSKLLWLALHSRKIIILVILYR